MKYNKNGDSVKWEILADDVQVTPEEDPLQNYPNDVSFKKEIDFDDEKALSDIFFEEFFPDVTGHGKKLDQYFDNIQASYYDTVHHDKIKFHDPDAGDPDWIVKQCYLLILAAATEADVGVDNLWKKGHSGGRRDYANFGQYMPINYFKAFESAAALMFTDEKYWYLDKRDKPWDIFLPALANFNHKRRSLFNVFLAMCDESMSGWKPKTSALGGLPNISYEPRKPVPLGTMLRNVVECITGSFVFQDVVQAPEVQAKKEFLLSNPVTEVPELSNLPDESPMTASAAETLRLCKGAEVEAGGWFGGDAWFGSVMSAVEAMVRLGVYTTFVVKSNNKYFYPMEAIHAVLRTRHGTRPAGHWVVMKATIANVKLIAIAYAWSQKGVSFFISTCGSTNVHPIKYESKFEDEWGNTQIRLINRPSICHFLYEYLPLIDEHNKQRQAILALEKRWKTKDCWFRLICTLLGMSTVDFHRFYRYDQIRNKMTNTQDVDNTGILKFSDLICGSLKQWPTYAIREQLQNRRDPPLLLRVRNEEGLLNLPPTTKQRDKHKTVGNAVVLNCYICRKYLKQDGSTDYRTTQFWCAKCRMPLCNKDRRGEAGGRTMSCVQEHTCTDEEDLACNEICPPKKKMPKTLQVSLWPRRSGRDKGGNN